MSDDESVLIGRLPELVSIIEGSDAVDVLVASLHLLHDAWRLCEAHESAFTPSRQRRVLNQALRGNIAACGKSMDGIRFLAAFHILAIVRDGKRRPRSLFTRLKRMCMDDYIHVRICAIEALSYLGAPSRRHIDQLLEGIDRLGMDADMRDLNTALALLRVSERIGLPRSKKVRQKIEALSLSGCGAIRGASLRALGRRAEPTTPSNRKRA